MKLHEYVDEALQNFNHSYDTSERFEDSLFDLVEFIKTHPLGDLDINEDYE